MDKKSWYGPGVVSGRESQAFPHKTSNVGNEGPKRKTPLKKKPVKSTKIPMASKPLTDKYGRVISRAEFNKREGYRKTIRSGATADAKERTINSSATSLKAKTESKRRTKYRKNAPNDTYRTRTKNSELPVGISSRAVNTVTKKVAKKTVGTTDSKARAASAMRSKMASNYSAAKAKASSLSAEKRAFNLKRKVAKKK
jgi:hypothetical protein